MAKSKKNKIPKGIEITSENKCSFCKGSVCCNYITQQIDTPRKKSDFNFLLWQVAHRDVQIYKDEDGWFLLIVNNPCQYLEADGRCGIYDTRPQICRDYENDYCEYDSPAEEGFELHFRDHEELLAYCRKRFKKWDKS